MFKGKSIITGLAVSVLIGAAVLFVDAAAPQGFAVVELFTSEGCSSCPPADALMAKVEKQYAGKPVYLLAYHVDYWNRLGWKDSFSSSEYSQRQRSYAKYLKLETVYTPQAVVNGTKEFVGSEAGTLHNAIEHGLQSVNPVNLTLSTQAVKGNAITVTYEAEFKPNVQLVLALVEKYAQTDVKAGENKGRNLSHVQIVRDIYKVEMKAGSKGSARLNLPDDVKPDNAAVIGMLQSITTGEIIGAAKVVL